MDKFKIICFVSKGQNIGNYTPYMGIIKMLKQKPAKTVHWSDYNSININDYDLLLVGGAGLLHKCFEDFWLWLAKQNIPVILWGLGTCWMDKSTSWMKGRDVSFVEPKILESMKKNIVLSNVRDEKTNEIYNLAGHVSFCPTAIGLDATLEQDRLISAVLTKSNYDKILYAHHDRLATKKEMKKIMRFCDEYTSNIFSSRETIHDIINKYLNAKLVISTRLHGCIIANSLDIPYIAYAKDGKIREFNKMYGGGLCYNSISDVKNAIESNSWKKIKISIDRDKIREFGKIVNQYIDEQKQKS